MLWVLGPPTHTNGFYGAIDGRIPVVNALWRTLAPCAPSLGFVDWRLLGAADGSFTWFLPGQDARPVQIRLSD
ncbi:hypothetical protein ACMWP9_34745, partial [Escherichia coli]